MLIVFITILFYTSFSNFRSWCKDRKESQEEPIIPGTPIERLIKVTLLYVADRSLINVVHLLAFLMILTCILVSKPSVSSKIIIMIIIISMIDGREIHLSIVWST